MRAAGTSRRAMIAGSVATGVMSLLYGADEKQTSKLPWIDAHSHIWTTDLKQYPLRDAQPVEVLQPRSFTDDELLAVAGQSGVGRVVLIQHRPYHGFDNSYLIDAWKKRPNTFRIVGQIEDRDPQVGHRMKQMLQTGVTGFRVGPNPDRQDWLAGDGNQQMWKTAAETRQNICCLINPEDLPDVAKWCGRYTDTPVVIDHFARVGIDGRIDARDLANLTGLAKYPGVRIKISAYYALGRKQPPHDELIPMIRRLFEAFGADRLMWASDAPYQLTEPNSYEDSIALVRDRLDFISDVDRKKLLCDTAEKTFFWK